MDAINWLVEVVIAITKHGFSSTAIIVAMVALLKVKGIQKRLLQRLPRRFRTEDRLDRLEGKIDALMSAGGVVWVAKETVYTGSLVKSSSILSRLARLSARFAGKYIMRRKRPMREYLKKLGRTKFQAFLLATLTNLATLALFMTGTVDLEGAVNQWMPMINLVVQLVVSAIYMGVEGSIDKARVNNGGTDNGSFTTPVEPTE